MSDSPAKDSKGDQGQGREKTRWGFLLLFLGGGFCRVCRRRMELVLSWFNSLLEFSAPEDLARRCAFLCKTNIEMRTLRHTVAGRR